MPRYAGFFFFSSRRRHTRCSRDWSSDVCSSDLLLDDLRALVVADVRVEGRGYRWRGLRVAAQVLLVRLHAVHALLGRSEERRVGKEGRSRRWRHHAKKKKKNKPPTLSAWTRVVP